MKKTKLIGLSVMSLFLIAGILTPAATAISTPNWSNPFLEDLPLYTVEDIQDIICQGGHVTYYMALYYENGQYYVRGYYWLNGEKVEFVILEEDYIEVRRYERRDCPLEDILRINLDENLLMGGNKVALA